MMPIFAFVDSGQQVADFPVRFGNEAALWCPTVDSCTGQVFGSWDQTSANFLPVKGYTLPASGGVSQTSLANAVIPLGPGSAYFALDYNMAAVLPYARVVLSVAQTSPRTLCMVAKWD